MSESLGPEWKTPAEKREEVVEKIAQDYLGITLETRGSDGLDFHDIAVWGLKHMMELAYLAGRESAVNDVVAITMQAK